MWSAGTLSPQFYVYKQQTTKITVARIIQKFNGRFEEFYKGMTWIHLKRSEGAVVNSGKILKQEVERMISTGQRVSDKFVLEFIKRRFNKTMCKQSASCQLKKIGYG